MHPDIQNNLKIRPAHIASFIVFLLVSMSTLTAKVYATDAVWPSKTTYKYANVNGKKYFIEKQASNMSKQLYFYMVIRRHHIATVSLFRFYLGVIM